MPITVGLKKTKRRFYSFQAPGDRKDSSWVMWVCLWNNSSETGRCSYRHCLGQILTLTTIYFFFFFFKDLLSIEENHRVPKG